MSEKPVNKKKRRSFSQTVMVRILIAMFVFGVFLFIPIVANLYNVQIIKHSDYNARAIRQQTDEYSVTASRGTIYDRNMNVMAYSATAETIFISPLEIDRYKEDPALIASGLSSILGVDEEKVLAMTKRTESQYEVVAKKVEESVADEVRAFIENNGLISVHLEETSKRYYPYSSLAAQIVGFVGTDNTGLSGIESSFDDTLSGTDGLIVTAKDGNGNEMLYKYEQFFEPEDGSDIVLTIDTTIQYFLEKNLEAAVEDFDVLNGACGIVMKVDTAEILGMATLTSYDPNNPTEIGNEKVKARLEELKLKTEEGIAEDGSTMSDEAKEEAKVEYTSLLAQAQYDQWRNRAVNDTYEPGSTFKVITMAMALEEKVVSTDETFYCSGSTGNRYIAGRTEPISCWYKSGHGAETLAQTLQNSCNPAFADIGLRLGSDLFYKYLGDFGFLEETGVDLPGESESIVWPKTVLDADYGAASLAVGAFGQTFKITPIQLATAYCAVVNGGYLMQPHIIKQVLDGDGNVVKENAPSVVRQVISEETSATVRSMMEGVVELGSGKNAKLSGYRIGGKTGTSEKLDEQTDDLIVSFYGVAPMDDPQVVVAVILDTPSTETGMYISGGVMAAPVASDIFADILPYLNIEPTYSSEEEAALDVTVPNVVGKSLGDATTIIEKDFKIKVVGNGDFVTGQTPNASSAIPSGSTVILYMGVEKDQTTVTVPKLTGMSAQWVKQELEYYGLYLHTKGGGGNPAAVASRQTVEPGTEVPIGTVIGVQFTDNSVGDR